MGCCGNKEDQKHEHANEHKAAGGCCGGSAMKKESCCKGSKIAGFFKMLLGKKCCGSGECKKT